jgi:hypothetical protein
MELRVDQIAEHLRKIKDEQGEEAYRQALVGLSKNLLSQGNTAPFIQELLKTLDDSLDLEPLKAEAETIKAKREETKKVVEAVSGGKDMNQVMVETMRQQMPNLKTQAQFNLVMQTFEGLQIYLNAAFGQDNLQAKKAREALNTGLDLAPKLGTIVEQAADSPEIKVNPDFINPPKEFTEVQTQQQLLEEIKAITSSEQLSQWYLANKPLTDSILSTKLRNELFDSIRDKKQSLSN